MAVETELKARAADLDAVRASLKGLGAMLQSERAFEDNWLLDRADGHLQRRGEALRVRLTGGRGKLTWKGPKRLRDGVKSREELELGCDDPEMLLTLFEKLGLERCFRYQKYRETWVKDGTQVMLDETPIGNFVEVEGEEAAVRALTEALAIPPDEVVVESYATLFSRVLAARGDDPRAMVFDRT